MAVIVAAPASGSGKTIVTLGLLRHLSQTRHAVVSAKVGPDYIDPAFHRAATGRPCYNLDCWAMRSRTIAAVRRRLVETGDYIVCEGVMGLFDGATAVSGSTADLAAMTGWPVVLVLDVHAQAASAAATARGFISHRADVRVAGLVFNRVGSERHSAVLRGACARTLPNVPVLGCLPRLDGLRLPSRHLGLVQAVEHPDLLSFLSTAANAIATHLDTAALIRLAAGGGSPPSAQGVDDRPDGPSIPLPGQRVAIADDAAFAFRYPHVIEGWERSGTHVTFFSPLADEAPPEDADQIYLPGGYPELFASRLAGNARFFDGLRRAARRGIAIYGECGGYMVLGDSLVDAAGAAHRMAGLLPLVTSMGDARLHLGYRHVQLAVGTTLGPAGAAFRGHEFHYARIVREGPGQPLFTCRDANGTACGRSGLVDGSVAGSFVHLIDSAGPAS